MAHYQTNAGGLSIQLIAVKKVGGGTFPLGINLTAFAQDSDPLDFPAVTIGEASVNLNGDLISNKTPNPMPVTLNIIPGSDDDRNLDILFQSNMAKRTPEMDTITLICNYPDGTKRAAISGICTSYVPGKGVTGAGKVKSRPYTFTFAEIVGN